MRISNVVVYGLGRCRFGAFLQAPPTLRRFHNEFTVDLASVISKNDIGSKAWLGI